MFHKLIAISLFAVCVTAQATSQTNIDTSNLDAAQIAEIQSIAASKNADALKQKALPDTPGAVVTLAATWGTQAAAAAEGFAKAISIAAKELGVTVNDFLHTDAGKLTAALIIWKVAGASIIHMLYGTIFFTTGMTFTRLIYTRLFTSGFVTVPYNRFWGLWQGQKLVRRPKSISDLHTDGEWLTFWVMIIIIGLTLIITGGIIG